MTLGLIGVGTIYVCAVAFVPDFTTRSPFVCLTRRWLGLQCPSCGMTRALACLVRLDFASALSYNPLVLVAAPFGLVLVIDSLLRASHRPGLAARMPWLTTWGWRLLMACFVAVGLVRAASWLAPECNPSGWLLPPAEFPPPPTGDQAERSDGMIMAWAGAANAALSEAERLRR